MSRLEESTEVLSLGAVFVNHNNSKQFIHIYSYSYVHSYLGNTSSVLYTGVKMTVGHWPI